MGKITWFQHGSRRLLDLVGGKELFEQAIEQSAEFDITKYITEYNEKLQQEQVIKPFNISKK